jgi:small subunit ribosomal protein S8
MHTDPVADMLTRIRNGCRARLERVDVPQSKLKEQIAAILKTEGYIADFRVVSGKHQGLIEIKLAYGKDLAPVITDIQRVSHPGMRRYFASDEIPTVRNGMGIVIMTTSRGVMTDREARKAKIGGEALCSVW